MFFNYDTKLFILFHITRRITSYTRNTHSNLGLHNRLLTNHPMTYVNQGEVITAIGYHYQVTWTEWQDYRRNNRTYNERGRINTSQEMWEGGQTMRLLSVISEQQIHTWNRISRTTCLFYYSKSSFQKLVLPLYSSWIQTEFIIEHTCISAVFW